MDAMLEPTVLQALWFAIIAFFFLGYFVLEGFDFGVQMNVAAFWRRGPAKRGTILQTIGPVWDGNEVWLITGGALLFAAFPEWYATRSEEHTSELQSRGHLVCRLLLE